MPVMTVHSLPADVPALPNFKPARPTGPFPMPANDNWPLRTPVPANDNVPGRPRPVPRIPGLPRLPLWPLAVPDLIDIIDKIEWYPQEIPYRIESGGWYLVLDCGLRPGAPPYTSAYRGPVSVIYPGHVANCAANQAPGNWQDWPGEYETITRTIPATHRTLILASQRLTNLGTRRNRNDVTWWRDASVEADVKIVNTPYAPRPNIDPMLDPNIVRTMPSAPANVPEPSPGPRPDRDSPPEWEWDSGPKRAPRPRARFRRRRAGKGDKKVLTRSKQFMIWFFNAMDALSENAEIIGAFYDALPEDVRKRWEKGRNDRQFIDSAGQYGIGGADWKLQAVYHNWHRIDPEEALWNVSRNLLQDQLYGVVHKNLPPGAFRATTGESTDFNDLVEKVLDLVDPRSYR